MSLKESGEMYLETIYMLRKKRGSVRSVDVAEHMNYSRASVSRGIGLLKKAGLLTVDAGGYITLTGEGEAAARVVTERHEVLSAMLVRLGVSEEQAAEDACRIEHVISEESFSAIKSHVGARSFLAEQKGDV